MTKLTLSKTFVITGIVILCLNASRLLIECKPVIDSEFVAKESELKDPLLSVPSENRYISLEQTRQEQPQLKQVHHFTYSQNPAHLAEYRPQEVQQYKKSVIVSQNEHFPEPSHEIDYNHKHEYVSLASLDQIQDDAEKKGEYPGQILYIGQDGDVSRTPRGAQELGTLGQVNMPNVADTISQSSAIPATILTEVPVKDMPQEVLDRLKKDYGVKVIATREHPGANLVINCDDYSNEENSICTKSTAFSTTINNNVPYSFAAPSFEEPVNEQPHESSDVSNSEHSANAETHVYITGDKETRDAGESSPKLESDHNMFGSINYNTGGILVSKSPNISDDEFNVKAEPSPSEGAESQPENDPQQAGFDIQPTSAGSSTN